MIYDVSKTHRLPSKIVRPTISSTIPWMSFFEASSLCVGQALQRTVSVNLKREGLLQSQEFEETLRLAINSNIVSPDFPQNTTGERVLVEKFSEWIRQNSRILHCLKIENYTLSFSLF